MDLEFFSVSFFVHSQKICPIKCNTVLIHFSDTVLFSVETGMKIFVHW